MNTSKSDKTQGPVMLALVMLLLCGGAAAIPLLDLYNFGSEAEDSLLPQADDRFSPPISLTPGYTLFGENCV